MPKRKALSDYLEVRIVSPDLSENASDKAIEKALNRYLSILDDRGRRVWEIVRVDPRWDNAYQQHYNVYLLGRSR